jgi:uncharacterized repeat protein (TIGR02059 family)
VKIGIGIGLGFRRVPVAAGGADVTAPTLVGNPVIDAAGTTLTLTYNEALDAGSTPAAGAFSLGGTSRTVTSVLVSGSAVALTLSGVIGIGVAVTVSYTAGGSPIQDLAGNDAANLVAQAVTNNSTQDVTAPTLSSAIINAAGTSLTLTYSEALDTGSVPALGAFTLAGTKLAALSGTPNVTGSTVVLTLAPGVISTETGITISYTAGGAPIQDVAGNDAANLVAQAVTNNSARTASPLDVPNLVFWSTAKDGATRANKVTAVNLTAIGAPAYQATGLNGRPTHDFTGVDAYTNADAAAVAAGTNANARSILTVSAFDTVDAADDLVSWGSSAMASNRTYTYGQSITSTGRMNARFVNDAGTSVSVAGSIQTDSTAHVYALVSPGTTVGTWIDNVADIVAGTALDPGTNTPNRIGLAARVDSVPDTFNDGRSSEELVYSRAITATERTYLSVDYLKAEWGTP